jgi:bisphosphoglycerate-dependent phosphoglycerate mutase
MPALITYDSCISSYTIRIFNAVATAQTKWKSLKDTYARNKKKKSGSAGDSKDDKAKEWRHQRAMSFLDNYNIPRT